MSGGLIVGRRAAMGLTAAGLAGAAVLGGGSRNLAAAGEHGDGAPLGLVTFTAPEAGIYRSSHVIETATGFVVVDAPFRKSDAVMVREQLAVRGKPIEGVLITHMHPDHNFGLTELLHGSEAPIVATPAVADAVAAAEDFFQGLVPNVIGAEETERHRRFPDTLIDSGGQITLGGAVFQVVDMGAAESAADAIWTVPALPQLAFVGDLVFHRMHSWVANGTTAAFITALEALQRDAPAGTLLVPGHGSAVPAAAIPRQIAYLRAFREAVIELADGRPMLSDAQKEQLVARMMALEPSPMLAFGITLGADAVAAELAAEG